MTPSAEIGGADTGDRAPAFLAVDGGGTHTRAVIVDAAGRRLGCGVAAGCNQRAVGLRRALARVRAAVAEATRQAGSAPPFARAWFGLAGIDRPDDVEGFRAQLASLAVDARVTNDAELVLAGLGGAPGVAVIAGTGSIALAIDRAGHLVRVGGWGHLIGDEGSAYDIGRRALQTALRMADGRAPRGVLLGRVLDHFGVARADDLIERVYDPFAKSAIAALAPAVLRVAHAGDPVARAITQAAVAELAELALAAAVSIAEDGPVTFALGGGLLVGDAIYRRAVVRRVRRLVRVGVVRVVAEPALVAAAALARGDPGDPPRSVGAQSADAASALWARSPTAE